MKKVIFQEINYVINPFVFIDVPKYDCNNCSKNRTGFCNFSKSVNTFVLIIKRSSYRQREVF